MRIKKNYHLVNWKTCCLPKKQGGLGLLNLYLMNKALLAKWFWKLETEDGLWINLLLNKYNKNKCVSGIKKRVGDSQFWSSLLKVKHLFNQHVKKQLGHGRNTEFWEDWWVGSKQLKDAYPGLYNINFDHEISIAEAINKGWDNFTFIRTLIVDSLDLWNSLNNRCEAIRMYGGKDKPMWMLTNDRNCSVKSLYIFLIKTDLGYPQKFLWKVKVPAEIKMFLWLLAQKSILTKDNRLIC